ncbi:kinase-like domain-containing protein [Cantharellus anzutake]|uniref:kinase-like domain-containing protein n=1 Tax=Cantharellus anzutake TaxID=1750568 RepID=UPI0019077316|nr:kinase-like domain-containing protein [Cantharellus anzutake]KAF8329583.1 kinase-like domain-containing protein [Cantharellus anzutake]
MKMLWIPGHKEGGLDVELFRRRVIRECGIWSSLNHPNITPFYGWVLDVGCELHAYILLQFAENRCVNHYIKNTPGADRRKIVYEAAKGLSYLHTQDIVHGDIKPTNILINASGVATLCDFGLSRKIGDPATDPQGSSYNSTAQYSAPELVIGEGLEITRTKASDIWALGCTGMEILRGYPPYSAQRVANAMSRRIGPFKEFLPESPEWAFRGCLQFEPEARTNAQNVIRLLAPTRRPRH